MSPFAVITSDLQRAAAFKHTARTTAVQQVLPALCDFFGVVRSHGIPIIHLQLVVSRDDPRSAGLPEDLQFSEGTSGCALLPEVLHPMDIIVPKRKDSGFFETSLGEVLQNLKVDTVMLVGMQTQICIQTTAADAYFRGYNVLVPSDGVISTRPEDTQRALEWMANYCASVTTLGEICSKLQRSGDSVR